MKIEMGESLIYSWLRHVKECQIVQTNWKSSPMWEFNHETEIESMLSELDSYFSTQYGYNVFKKSVSLSQIMQQGECDVLGINLVNNNSNEINYNYYAVEVAYHHEGLQYGSKVETVLKVVAKCIRAVFSLYGFFGAKQGQIIFASPKIGKTKYDAMMPLISYVDSYFKSKGFGFDIRIICNDEFNTSIIEPVIMVSKTVADTGELFLRSYQLIDMFSDIAPKSGKVSKKSSSSSKKTASATTTSPYDELKVGKIAQSMLKNVLESGKISSSVITMLQNEDYSKAIFGIKYPLLVLDRNAINKDRYYAATIKISRTEYYMCNDWYDKNRDALIKWIEENK